MRFRPLPWDNDILDRAEQIMGGLPEGVTVRIEPGDPPTIKITRSWTIAGNLPDRVGVDPVLLVEAINANLAALDLVIRSRLSAEPARPEPDLLPPTTVAELIEAIERFGEQARRWSISLATRKDPTP